MSTSPAATGKNRSAASVQARNSAQRLLPNESEAVREIVALALDAAWNDAIQTVENHLRLTWAAEAITAALRRGKESRK